MQDKTHWRIFSQFTNKFQVAYVNPKAFLDNGWKIADWFYLNHNGRFILIQLLPAEKIPFGFIQISEHSKDDLSMHDLSQNIFILKGRKPILSAHKIIITQDLKIDRDDQELFLILVKQYLIELGHVIKGKQFQISFKTRLFKCQILHILTFNGGKLEDNDYIYKISNRTSLSIDEQATDSALQRVLFSDVGGLEDQLEELVSVVKLGLFQNSMFRDFGLKPVKGVLLYGPPGVRFYFFSFV